MLFELIHFFFFLNVATRNLKITICLMYVACIILLLDTVMLHGSSLYNIAYSINVSYNQKKCKFS